VSRDSGIKRRAYRCELSRSIIQCCANVGLVFQGYLSVTLRNVSDKAQQPVNLTLVESSVERDLRKLEIST
jgi:hypothetical protein